MVAPSLTSSLASGSTTNGTSYVTASISMASGQAGLLTVCSAQTAGDPGAPSSLSLPSGITASLIGGVMASTNDRMSVYWLTGSGTGQITINFSGTQQVCTWHVDIVTDPGVQPTNPVTSSGTGTAVTSTLTGLTAGNSTWSAVWVKGQTTHTAEGGWTQLATRVSMASPSVSSSTQWRADVADTTPGTTLGGSNTWATLALEIPAAASAQALTAPLISSTATLYAPTIGRGAVALTLALIASTAATYAPTISTGPVTITAPAIAATATTYAPTIGRGPVAVTAPLVASTTTLHAPSVTAGPVAVTAPLIPGTSTLYAPTLGVTGGAQALTAPLITSTSALYGPTLTAGPVAVTAPLVASTATLYAPTVATGTVALTAPAIASGSSVYAPSLAVAGVTITVPLLGSSAVLHAPSLGLAGVVTLTAPLIASTSTLHGPSLAVGAVAVTAPLIPAGSALYAPTLGRGAVAVVAPLVSSTSTLYAPTVARGPVTVTAPLLGSTTTLHAPALAPGVVVITVPLLGGGAVLYAPTLSADGTATVVLGPLARVREPRLHLVREPGADTITEPHTHRAQEGRMGSRITRTYRAADEDPAIAIEWLDRDGHVIDTTSATWTMTITSTTTGAVVSKTSGITGAATSPNVVIGWATGELAAIGAGRHEWTLTATIGGRDRTVEPGLRHLLDIAA